MTTSTAAWFTVDKEGLAKLMERKGKEFILYELLQNSWDTNAKKVDVSLRRSEIKGYAEIEVIDDHPDGWKELAHAWTLYAESEKKGDAEKRGRFNLGEKLVLALCRTARIETTTGGVDFGVNGRTTLRSKRAAGSRFSALVRMNQDERVAVMAAFLKLIPPPNVVTTLNGATVLPTRMPLKTIEATLSTEVADGEGILRRSSRKAKIEIYEPFSGETASIYEMGIPVVETGDRFHYNVLQKVPLNADRDNVTPAYLQALRTVALNAMHESISKEDAVTPWVRDAAADPAVVPAAVETVMTHRFGEKRVIADPTDPEGTKLAMSQGYTVVPGGSLSGGEWANVKRDQVMLPAGQVTPSPKVLSGSGEKDDEVPLEKWTSGMTQIFRYAHEIGARLLDTAIQVKIVNRFVERHAAWYSPGFLTFNLARLGHGWFDQGPREAVDELLIHEFGHHFSGDHLSEAYHDVLCKLGAKLARIVAEHPYLFQTFGRKVGGGA